jgi:quercetin dioxygenase-like cupin family protein
MNDLEGVLAAEGLAASRWSNAPGDRYDAHAHPFDKVLVCASGSIVFGLPDLGDSVALEAGDRVDLPAGTRHDAVVGSGGVTCLEAHVPAGTLGGLKRHPSGSWYASGHKGDAAETAEDGAA